MATEFPISANTDPAVKDIDQLIAALRKAGQAANMTEKEIEDIIQDVKRLKTEGTGTLNNLNKSFNNFVNDGIKKVSNALVAAFAVDKLMDFGKAVIAITAEFQKFEAVLTNTLGSKSAARIALNELVEIAAKTPFSVQQLTASYIKLVNQGFKPTREEIIKLGDLAASTGKDFDVLTEAIIDAQTGEFERLKEFGIRASKEGDKVTFTFKGVKTQVDFTADSIRKYILALGDAEGISGSMAAISGTLGGQISNLGDTWDTFLKTIGDGNKGVLKETISLLSQALQKATELLKTDEQRLEESISSKQAEAIEVFKLYVKGYEDIDAARAAFMADNEKKIQQLNDEFHALSATEKKQASLIDRALGHGEAIEMENRKRDEKLVALNDEIVAYGEVGQAIEDYIASLQKEAAAQQAPRQIGIIERLEKQIKALEALKEKATSIIEIERLNDRLYILSSRLEMIKNSGQGLASVFDDKVLKDFADSIEKDGSEMMKGVFDRADLMMGAFTDRYANELKKRKALQKQHEEDMKDIREAAFQESINLVNAFSEFQAARNADQISRLEEQREYELRLAGDNDAAKQRINNEFDAKERQLKRQQAERERRMALFNIAIHTAEAVAEALPNYVLAAIVAASGLVQAGLVASEPMPKFWNGVYSLEGPGTSTSDSIPAWLSRGESVVPENRHKEFGFLLKEIIEDPSFDLWDARSMIDQKIPTQYSSVVFAQAKGADSPELLDAIRDNTSAMKNLKQVNVVVDNNGFKAFVQSGNHWTEYANENYSL